MKNKETFDKCHEQYIHKWNWLSENPDKTLKDYRETFDEQDYELSYACTFAILESGGWLECAYCPVKYNFKDNSKCCGGLTSAWNHTRNLELKSQIAKILANLKWTYPEN